MYKYRIIATRPIFGTNREYLFIDSYQYKTTVYLMSIFLNLRGYSTIVSLY